MAKSGRLASTRREAERGARRRPGNAGMVVRMDGTGCGMAGWQDGRARQHR